MNTKIQEIVKNKKAYFDYEIINSWEAGVELRWYEVKSIRNKQVNLKGSYISFVNGRPEIKGMHISPWKSIPNKDFIDPDRPRIVFLHKKNILYLTGKIKESGYSIVPLELYFKWNLIKVKVALVKWRKKYEKKQVLKERDMDKQAKIAMSKYL